MDKTKNTSTSDSFICKKFRQALTNCPTLQAIHNRISLYRQGSKTMAIDSNSASLSPAKTTAIVQIKPTRPQNPKVHSEEAQVIPIKFDYSTPISKTNGIPPRVRISENGKSKADTEQQHGKKDMNYAFSEYIERARGKIRAMSNVGGWSQGEPAPDDEANKKKKDNHRDHFSNFIHLAKKKIRTTSTTRRE